MSLLISFVLMIMILSSNLSFFFIFCCAIVKNGEGVFQIYLHIREVVCLLETCFFFFSSLLFRLFWFLHEIHSF
ncbi:hypothetical protein BCR41DRAFT_148254 [Lobosporangium transversale]|uniref:Uncharacterized protein n=1 Tax=Lobosporangium transversale TaxID=64571 RepID=A0A1Y2GHT0_9FUNG|nr:hypothetical protein BCR41DRAFT_148254 [Lobosporangium transversale]ORZ07956.1 hypothetical protein BCR41DRAFT_148254 [Lobosporangium transversale]|eukprot:XP_021878190.1 hypothetical protein BCR41DRAFT_148254 [Lobosporangium transversale]